MQLDDFVMKKYLFLICSIIILTSLNQPGDPPIDPITEFFDKLDIGESDQGELIDIESENFWSKFSLFGNKSNKENLPLFPPNIKPIIEFPLLLNGDTVKEEKVKTRKRTIGEAFCVNGKPTIRYYTENKYLDVYGLAFFRMHEYAHFLLGHMECSKNVSPKPELEFAADKKAIELLVQFEDGERVADHARGIMLGMKTRRTSTHPSSYERAMAFYDR